MVEGWQRAPFSSAHIYHKRYSSLASVREAANTFKSQATSRVLVNVGAVMVGGKSHNYATPKRFAKHQPSGFSVGIHPGIICSTKSANDEKLAARLWERMERELEQAVKEQLQQQQQMAGSKSVTIWYTTNGRSRCHFWYPFGRPSASQARRIVRLSPWSIEFSIATTAPVFL